MGKKLGSREKALRAARERVTEAPPPAPSGPMSKDEARNITDRINRTAEDLCVLLVEAHERKAWKALGYGSWREYAEKELRVSRQHSYRILDQGRVTLALREAVAGDEVSPDGVTSVRVSESEARDVKPHLEEVQSEIRERVESGEDPQEAVSEAVQKHREKPEPEPPPSEPEDDEPDLLAEYENEVEENARLRERIEILEADDTKAELSKLHKKYGQLDGRLQQVLRTQAEAEREAKYAKGQLRKIREALGVERDRDILPAIEALRS